VEARLDGHLGIDADDDIDGEDDPDEQLIADLEAEEWMRDGAVIHAHGVRRATSQCYPHVDVKLQLIESELEHRLGQVGNVDVEVDVEGRQVKVAGPKALLDVCPDIFAVVGNAVGDVVDDIDKCIRQIAEDLTSIDIPVDSKGCMGRSFNVARLAEDLEGAFSVQTVCDTRV
jgi:hypothetical protein